VACGSGHGGCVACVDGYVIRGGACRASAVIAIISTLALHMRIDQAHRAWANASRIPVLVITDSAEQLSFVDPRGAVTVKVTPCPTDWRDGVFFSQ
jgi:hypothetical protein